MMYPIIHLLKKKDEITGKWIECGVCNVIIKVRATFGFSEWEHHCSSNKHCLQVKETERCGTMKQLTTYFGSTNNNTKTTASQSTLRHRNKRTKVVIPCPGFNYGKNSELLQLYNKYKKVERLNESFIIHYQNGVWSTHSVDCTNEAIMTRHSRRADRCACQKCFDFPFVQLVKDRVDRMAKIYHIEQHITEPTTSQTGYLAVTNFLKTNTSNASPVSTVLRERCLI